MTKTTTEAAPVAETAGGVESENKLTPAQIAAEEEANLSHDERGKRLIAGYEHGLASNSPRTTAELNEIKALLGGE